MRLLITLAIGAVALLFVPAPPRISAASGPRFLDLPFTTRSGMHVQRGWYAQTSTGVLVHHAIDYIHGTPNDPATWRRFRVVAAASGEACAQVAGRSGCIDIPGERLTNRVRIKHRVGGRVFYTVYEDLETIGHGIPVGRSGSTARIARGQLVGVAGDNPDLLHLHFEVLDAHLRPIDPYDIYGRAWQYPDPAGSNTILAGTRNLWLSNPPRPQPLPVAAPPPVVVPGPPRAQVGGPALGSRPIADGPAELPIAAGSRRPTAIPPVEKPLHPAAMAWRGFALGLGAMVALLALVGAGWLGSRRHAAHNSGGRSPP